MNAVIRLAVYAAIGLYDRVKEELADLVKRGEMRQHEAQTLLSTVEEHERNRWAEIQERIESAARGAVQRLPPVALRRDITALEDRVRDLELKLQVLEAGTLPDKVEAGTPPR